MSPMICRVLVPTALYENELETVPQPRVRVSFDGENVLVLPAQARAAAEWLEAADFAFEREAAGDLAAALRRAIAQLDERPPRLVPERYLGLVEGLGSDGAPRYLDVTVETAVIEPNNPRVTLRMGRSLEHMNDTWWLRDEEARTLGVWAAARAPGVLTEAGPNQRPFLRVQPDGDGLTLRFEDDLLAEHDDDGTLALAGDAADRLAALLAAALAVVEEQPAYVFVPPEPRDLLVAELRW
jgi:hypothetical protein